MVNPSHYHQTLSSRAAPVYHRLMPVDPCAHDSDDSAERYAWDLMPEPEAKEFELHCDTCATCSAVLVRELAVMYLVRTAGPAPERKPGVIQPEQQIA
jgi:hypothetical protein